MDTTENTAGLEDTIGDMLREVFGPDTELSAHDVLGVVGNLANGTGKRVVISVESSPGQEQATIAMKYETVN